MVLFSALLKMQGMTLKALLNPFMPHYPPIYKMCLQRVLAPLRVAPVLLGFCSVPRRNRMAVIAEVWRFDEMN